MPLTVPEIFEDVPALADAVSSFETAIKTLPPGDKKAADWAKALGIGGILMSAAAAYDQLAGGPVSIEEFVTLLAADPAGPVGKILTLFVKVEGQIKS